jgi:hypothetical protein
MRVEFDRGREIDRKAPVFSQFLARGCTYWRALGVSG